MNKINLNSIQNFRIPFEGQLWELLLNDPYFKQIENEIENFYSRYNSCFIRSVSENSRVISPGSKEPILIKNICKHLKLPMDIYVYEKSEPRKFKTVSCYYKNNLIMFIISKPINKLLLERELIPIFAHELGHLIFEPPIPIPGLFFYNKLVNATDSIGQNHILRLLYLSNILIAINEFNADRLSLLLTSFEAAYNSLMLVKRLNSRKRNLFDIDIILREFPYLINEYSHLAVKNYAIPNYRIYAMYLFSKENNLIESYSLNKIEQKVSLSDIFNIGSITKNYNKMLNQKRSGNLYKQLFKAFITDDILGFNTSCAYCPAI